MKGDTGSEGATGATGNQGIIGPRGATGATGAKGLKGATGAQGLKGDTGSEGATGATGNQGIIGPRGATGATGAKGLKGATGAQGLKGDTGSEGATGATGATGAKGLKGDTGVVGTTGATGAKGATGIQGEAGATGSEGATGAQGAQGATGTTGPEGIAGESVGLPYTWRNNTEYTDPGAGSIKVSGGKLLISNTDRHGSVLSGYLKTWDDSTAAIRGYIVLQQVSDHKATVFTVTGDIDEESGWMAIPSGLLSFGGLTPDEPMTVSFYRNGDAGAEGPSVAPRFNYLTNMEATDPNSGNLKLGQTKSIAELLRSMPVTDSLEHGSAPSTFTQLPWAGNGGTWSEWGWSPSSYIPGTYEADSRSGDYWNSNELDGDAMVGMTKTTGGLLSPRQFSVWLFSEAASKPSGYQLAIVGENSTEVAFILRKWVGGTETVLEEVKEVPFSEGDSIYLLAFEGKLSMWHGEGNAVPVSVGSEVADSTFTQGYSAIDGNGSNPRLIDFKTGVLSGVGTVGSLYISQTDADGGSLGPYIDTWDDSNSSPRGFLLLRRVDSPGTFAIFRVNGEIVDKGNWDELTIEHVAGNGGFSDEDRLAVEFSRTGDKGDTGPAGSHGTQRRDRAGRARRLGSARLQGIRPPCDDRKRVDLNSTQQWRCR